MKVSTSHYPSKDNSCVGRVMWLAEIEKRKESMRSECWGCWPGHRSCPGCLSLLHNKHQTFLCLLLLRSVNCDIFYFLRKTYNVKWWIFFIIARCVSVSGDIGCRYVIWGTWRCASPTSVTLCARSMLTDSPIFLISQQLSKSLYCYEVTAEASITSLAMSASMKYR